MDDVLDAIDQHRRRTNLRGDLGYREWRRRIAPGRLVVRTLDEIAHGARDARIEQAVAGIRDFARQDELRVEARRLRVGSAHRGALVTLGHRENVVNDEDDDHPDQDADHRLDNARAVLRRPSVM